MLVSGALWGLLPLSLLMALGQSSDLPAIASIRPGDQQVMVTVTAPGWVQQLTLESRTDVAAGPWTRRAWQRVTNAGAITMQLDVRGEREFFRAGGDDRPSFFDRVTMGLGLLRASYPEAVLLEVDATGPGSGTNSTNPNDISQLRIVCRVNGGTALITATGGLTFDPVSFVAQPWLGSIVIAWPVPMDVMEADILLQHAGYAGTFSTINLRQPLYPGLVEPYYIFQVTNVGYVFIGSNSKTNFIGH